MQLDLVVGDAGLSVVEVEEADAGERCPLVDVRPSVGSRVVLLPGSRGAGSAFMPTTVAGLATRFTVFAAGSVSVFTGQRSIPQCRPAAISRVGSFSSGSTRCLIGLSEGGRASAKAITAADTPAIAAVTTKRRPMLALTDLAQCPPHFAPAVDAVAG
jgi:hypothetical protein